MSQNCSYHPSLKGSTYCTECWKPICAECAATIPEYSVCPNCAAAVKDRVCSPCVAGEMVGSSMVDEPTTREPALAGAFPSPAGGIGGPVPPGLLLGQPWRHSVPRPIPEAEAPEIIVSHYGVGPSHGLRAAAPAEGPAVTSPAAGHVYPDPSVWRQWWAAHPALFVRRSSGSSPGRVYPKPFAMRQWWAARQATFARRPVVLAPAQSPGGAYLAAAGAGLIAALAGAWAWDATAHWALRQSRVTHDLLWVASAGVIGMLIGRVVVGAGRMIAKGPRVLAGALGFLSILFGMSMYYAHAANVSRMSFASYLFGHHPLLPWLTLALATWLAFSARYRGAPSSQVRGKW